MKIFKSLRYFITLIIGVMLMVICMVVIGYNYSIFSMMQERIDNSIATSLQLLLKDIENSLSGADSFLLSQSVMNEELRILKNSNKELERYLAEVNIINNFQSSINNYKILDGISMFHLEQDIYISSRQSFVPPETQTMMQKHSEEIVNMFQEQGQGKWYFAEIQGNTYFLRTLENQQIYVNGWVSTSNLLKGLGRSYQGEGELLLLYDAKQSIVDGIRPGQSECIPKDELKELEIEPDQMIQVYSERGYSLAVRKQQRGLMNSIRQMGFSALLGFISVLCLIIVIFLLLNRYFMIPMHRLTFAMQQLSQGDFDIRLQDSSTFEEFEMVNKAFDAMTSEIKSLKINVYEEQIRKQSTELQYLQAQVNPHFLTNCLNLIQNLSIMGRNDCIQETAGLLSNYIRYTLKNKTYVSIEQEVIHIKDYIALQKMRYAEQLSLRLQVREELLQEMVPCMMIQTFVDNAVKHQMSPEEQLVIEVKICSVILGDQNPYLFVTISDNGEGFTPDIMETLQKGQSVVKKDGEHIGIHNVVQRLSIMYRETANIQFSNNKDEGAKIEIYIPRGGDFR